ncbi:class I SAM-dependent methyltransferase [Candidatus Woesearchaeota archaeon]|nr:class I SAM-dependent methyltransferase [Candidatus Woesearchaeota archaeon]
MLSDRSLFAFNFIPENTQKLLDLGCGNGSTANEYFAKAKEVYGLEIKESAVSEGKRLNPEIKFFLTSDGTFPFKDKFFDVIVMTDVFEHVINEKLVIEEVRRTLKTKGCLILSVPHKGLLGWLDPFNLKFQFPRLYKWWKGQKFNPDIYKIDDWHRHYSLEDLKKFLEAEFEIETVHRGGLIIYPLTWLFNDMLLHKFPILRKIFTDKIMRFFFNLDYKINFRRFGYHIILKAKKL